MTSPEDVKVRDEFIARCNGLQIKAKEKQENLKPASAFTNWIAPKHPGHYRAPANSSFERQIGTISSGNQPTSRPSSQPGKASATSPTFDTFHSVPISTSTTSKLSAAARKQAIAQCHQDLAACYEKLATLHALEVEEATINDADIVKRAQVHLNNGTLQLEIPFPFTY